MPTDSALVLATQDGICRLPITPDGRLGTLDRQLESVALEAICRDVVGTLYTGDGKGQIYRCEGGQTWLKVYKRFPKSRGLWSLVAHPVRAAELYAGLEPVALWVSRDGGISWEELKALREHPSSNQWRFYEPAKPHIRAISFDQPGKQLFIGIEEGGMLMSRNDGESFEDCSGDADRDLHAIYVDAVSPIHLLVATGDGLYQSHSSGQRWIRSNDGLDRSYVVPIVQLPYAQDVFCVGAANQSPSKWRLRGADAAIYRSDNGGKCWVVSDGPFPLRGMVSSIVVVPDHEGLLFAGTTDGVILHSSDEGKTWRTVVENLPRVEEMVVASSP